MVLGAPAGTDVVASADGIVYEVGYSATGLGNYVYIEHQTGDGVLYTAYGHMLDDSIVVEKDQPIMKGQKIGEVGSTGASTGYHLHFMIMKNKISFKSEDLIDPYFVIYGLN
jgi:murein DD-endopeptidase MepM/ murein hydrolase activator NlpD